MASVNLWQLITTVADKRNDSADADRCRAIQAIIGRRFGSELTLEIDAQTGVWCVKIFNHEDSTQYVEIAVHPDGYTSVERGRNLNPAVYETNKINF
jgi:hypothetical protein